MCEHQEYQYSSCCSSDTHSCTQSRQLAPQSALSQTFWGVKYVQGAALLIIRTVGFGIRKEEHSCCSRSNLQVCQREKGQPQDRIQKRLGLSDRREMERRGSCVHVDFFIMVTRICLLYYATLGSKTMDLELSVWDEMCIFVLLSWSFSAFQGLVADLCSSPW